MLSLASLLNPAPSGPPHSSSFSSSSSSPPPRLSLPQLKPQLPSSSSIHRPLSPPPLAISPSSSPSSYTSPSSGFPSSPRMILERPGFPNIAMPSMPPSSRQLAITSHAGAGIGAGAHAKGRPRGTIRYPPFEDVDETAMREIRRFRVTPFGSIQHSCAHIPYNSEKKDFFEKTGRESFEVFKYSFYVPGDGDMYEYSVMWDYNVGLVRMTPFFKCCQYGKTIPSKMLSMNPGLKDITHSITGGAIAAQGYWMPFDCAKAVCATFCFKIAGALIPIFGPDFPALCVPPDTPEYGRMVIDHEIVVAAAREAEYSRRIHLGKHTPTTTTTLSTGLPSPPTPGGFCSPQQNLRPSRHGDSGDSGDSGGRSLREGQHRLQVKTRLVYGGGDDSDGGGVYSTPSSACSSSGSGSGSCVVGGLSGHGGLGHGHLNRRVHENILSRNGLPQHTRQQQQQQQHPYASSWTPVNYPSIMSQPPPLFGSRAHHYGGPDDGYGANPLLSAVPRFTSHFDRVLGLRQPSCCADKRPSSEPKDATATTTTTTGTVLATPATLGSGQGSTVSSTVGSAVGRACTAMRICSGEGDNTDGNEEQKTMVGAGKGARMAAEASAVAYRDRSSGGREDAREDARENVREEVREEVRECIDDGSDRTAAMLLVNLKVGDGEKKYTAGFRCEDKEARRRDWDRVGDGMGSGVADSVANGVTDGEDRRWPKRRKATTSSGV